MYELTDRQTAWPDTPNSLSSCSSKAKQLIKLLIPCLSKTEQNLPVKIICKNNNIQYLFAIFFNIQSSQNRVLLLKRAVMYTILLLCNSLSGIGSWYVTDISILGKEVWTQKYNSCNWQNLYQNDAESCNAKGASNNSYIFLKSEQCSIFFYRETAFQISESKVNFCSIFFAPTPNRFMSESTIPLSDPYFWP